jgi:hypothetical protein
MSTTQEHQRLLQIPANDDAFGWRRWGPYLTDRAWGTVREDYSPNGDAWNHLPHDHARSRAYRWGEDGIAGLSDRYQLLCFAPAFWNGKDAILKERLFGVTGTEGNHGEDVKEYYFHVDNTPTHSYMKLLYKYPQEAYPYSWLLEENRRRNGQGFEFELLDTGIFDQDKYFDIFIEYGKIDPEDICIQIEAFNRGAEPAPLHILPHLWFRNIWAWSCEAKIKPESTKDKEPIIRVGPTGSGFLSIKADDTNLEIPSVIPARARLGPRTLYGPTGGATLFTDNETNAQRVFGEATNRKPHVKDAFHRFLVNKDAQAINPAKEGTKAALHYRFDVPAHGSIKLVLRLSDKADLKNPLVEAEAELKKRRAEADEFYKAVQPAKATDDEKRVQRQAFAGLLWSKQSYLYDVNVWFDGDCDLWKPSDSRRNVRNRHWLHLNSMRVMTMPDKWEYPWFAAWDLAFHCVAFAPVDPQFAKDQLWVLLFEQFQHPNGQIPAYEWEFSDLNPPVHAWAVWRVYNMDRLQREKRGEKGDRDFLERCFHKLLINFAWWINKVDSEGNNVFEGGFLGLDNITVIDRSEKLPQGVKLEQADATGWMGMFCLNLMRIALELAKENPVYEGLATKFFQHYTYVARAMKHMGARGEPLWDNTDGFFYDMLRNPDGSSHKFRVRSLVGLIPLFAVERLEYDWIKRFPSFTANFDWFMRNRKDLVEGVIHKSDHDKMTTYVMTIVDYNQITKLLNRMLDESEFLSDYGIRSLSKVHEKQPFWYLDKCVGYEPAEAVSKIKGGNSNWRGPIWFPTSFLLIESLRKIGKAFGNKETLTPPASKGKPLTFREMAGMLASRMISIFTLDKDKHRPVFGGTKKFQEDPNWRDYLLFYEYFHGDNGAGLGASHQTGWTGLIASLIDEWRK